MTPRRRCHSHCDLEQQICASSDEAKESPIAGLCSKSIYAHDLASLSSEIATTRVLIDQTQKLIHSHLASLVATPLVEDQAGPASSPLMDWSAAIQREAALCRMMQQAHFYRATVAVEGWCPTEEMAALREAVRCAVSGTGFPPAMFESAPLHPLCVSDGDSGSARVPPTSFPLNKFTSAFQSIVDTYGVPRYKEVNPALFTIITFPFLFGIMYGDIGHGGILAVGAIALCAGEKKLEQKRRRGQMGDALQMVSGQHSSRPAPSSPVCVLTFFLLSSCVFVSSQVFVGRYVLLLMSLFSIYAGCVYNDLFSVSVHAFRSGFSADPNGGIEATINERPYPFGLDPGWQNKQNELLFYSSTEKHAEGAGENMLHS